MFGELQDAVGRGMPNRQEDVRQVRSWLKVWDRNFHPGLSIGTNDTLDPFTAMAIARFQRDQLGERIPSGIVSPGDATARKLASTPGLKPEGRVLSLPRRTDLESLTEEDYKNAAAALDCEAKAIRAVAQVESWGSGFDSQGRPRILFEPHHFNRNTYYLFEKSNPELTIQSSAGYGSLSVQWLRLEAAYKLRSRAALLSTSWGKFQILGENYRDCKYPLLELFISAMCTSEKNHLKAFVQFVKSDHQRFIALQRKDWKRLARAYNGSGYKTYHYDGRLEDAYEKLGR